MWSFVVAASFVCFVFVIVAVVGGLALKFVVVVAVFVGGGQTV